MGGMMGGNDGPQDETMSVLSVNLSTKKLQIPKLSDGSARPPNRMRHASCVVNASFLPQDMTEYEYPMNTKSILITGGYLRRAGMASTSIMSGLNRLTLLQPKGLCDGSEICWYEFDATGLAPEAIYHHQCGSFAGGKKVIVFGGDIPDSDPEYFSIRTRSSAACVYVLNVENRHWEKIATTGMHPSWRSLHIGVTYTGLVDRHEHFVTMGGTDDHMAPFSGGDAANMYGYSLDLESFVWRKSSEEGFQPVARLRFGGEKVGRHLLVYGGYSGSSSIPEDQKIVALNLITLRWKRVSAANRAYSYPDAPGAGLRGGCIAGGVKMSIFGVSPVPKLDFLYLSQGPVSGEEAEDENANIGEVEEEESSDDDAAGGLRIGMRQPDGSIRVLRMPAALAVQLMRSGMVRPAGDTDADNQAEEDED
mmetsp:Transcript_76154/g.119921  ORF Transcript_76154/g.119921 Transcript_76154/m.119921 type:complete len:421 (+) Transcript_76154:66-1328(+)